MFELYLDTADVQKVARLHESLPIFGVTTNPSILAHSGQGIRQILPALSEVLGEQARFHVQVVSSTVSGMLEEAKQLHDLPFDIVVKVPTTPVGLAAIKQMKALHLTVLATAIYSEQQGFLAALNGADYLAPYINRIDMMGVSGVNVVKNLQLLIDKYQLNAKLLPASFKNTRQVMEVLQYGVGALTIPVDIAEKMMHYPGVQAAVEQFSEDWQGQFGGNLSFES